MMYSSVVSYHVSPYTCGVARFNQALARTLGIQVVSVSEFLARPHGIPFLSLKFEEIPDEVAREIADHVSQSGSAFDLFLHGIQVSGPSQKVLVHARTVYVGSVDHADSIRPFRSDIIALFAPGTPFAGDQRPFDLKLLTFGMAHKIRSDGYRKLGEILSADSRSYQLEISTALHEGTSFSDDFFSVTTEISNVFKGNVSFLGFLADGEVSRRLRAADALIAFFPNGARENNTTVLSAMSHGCAVITNLDNYSPNWMKHGVSIFDINKLREFPSALEIQTVRDGAVNAVAPYNFGSLSAILINGIA